MADSNFTPMTVAGEQGVFNAAAFADDPKGTLGYLRFPYQDAVLAFEFDTGTAPDSWVLSRDSVTVGDSGVGDTDTSTGLLGEQTEADTSLLKNGFFSSTSHFTVTGIAIRPSTLAYVPAVTSTGDGTTAFCVNRTGVSADNCQGIAGLLIKGALEGAYIEFYQQSRKCYALYGKVEEMPQGFGFASMNDVTNGLVGKCNMERSRRPVIIPPGNSNTPEYVWRITFGRKISIAPDPSFDAPADNDEVALKLCVFFDGYFSDSVGNPLIADGDVFEARIAAGLC
jgi:hypothetical protein